MYSKSNFILTVKAITTLARLRMTVFSAVTYACAAFVGSSLTDEETSMISTSPNVFLYGWSFVFVCQVSAHLLGEYYDLPSDRFSYLASPSPFTGGSRVLVCATNTPTSVISPETCKKLGQICTVLAFTMTLVGLSVLDLGQHQFTLLLLSWLMIVIAHQYSAPPLKLNHRALGEFSAALVMNILLPYFGALLNVCNNTVPTNLKRLHSSLAFLIIPNFFLKILVFLILNLADRRADFLGGKSTLALVLSPPNIISTLYLLLFATYLSAILVVFLVPDAFSVTNILALIFMLATAPFAIDIVHMIKSPSASLSPETMKAVLQLAPLPVLFLFFSHFAFKFIGHPFQIFSSPHIWIRLLPILPFLHAFIVQGSPKPMTPNFLTNATLLANKAALHENSRVVIVGGGIAGLIAAAELQSLGISFVVLEQRVNAEEANRGADLGLWPSAKEILDKLIPDKDWWVENSMRICQVNMQALGSAPNDQIKFLRAVNMETVTKHRGFYLVARQPLMQKLRSLIKSEAIVYAARVIKITECESFATVKFVMGNHTDKELTKIHTHSAQLVIGADGINSICRTAIHDILNAGLTNNSDTGALRYAGEICYRGLVDMTLSESTLVKPYLDMVGANTMPLLMGPGLRASYSYINEHQTVACWWVKEKLPHDQAQSTWRNEDKKLTGVKWPDALIKLRALTDDKNMHVQHIVDRVSESKWCSHRIVLVGDAAHPVTPNLAQGANMAIEDVHFLIRALHSTQHQVDGFIQYVTERQAHVHKVANESYKQAKLGQISNPLLVWFREFVLQYMPASIFERRLTNVNMWEEPRS